MIVCKTVRPMLYTGDVVLSALSVWNVGVLWPNGWMDQDATWYRGRPRPRRYCVRWGPSSPTERGTTDPTFRPVSIVAKRSPISATVELLLKVVRQFNTLAYHFVKWYTSGQMAYRLRRHWINPQISKVGLNNWCRI